MLLKKVCVNEYEKKELLKQLKGLQKKGKGKNARAFFRKSSDDLGYFNGLEARVETIPIKEANLLEIFSEKELFGLDYTEKEKLKKNMREKQKTDRRGISLERLIAIITTVEGPYFTMEHHDRGDYLRIISTDLEIKISRKDTITLY